MLTTPKAFDCVEIKRRAQEKLRAEYDARKNEFPSFFAFLDAKSKESAQQQVFWSKVATKRQEAAK